MRDRGDEGADPTAGGGLSAGDTFRYRASRPGTDERRHLWVVLSDTDRYPDEILIVFITTLKARMDQTCILEPDDHPFLDRESTVAYSATELVTAEDLRSSLAAGEIESHPPLAPATLQRIRFLALSSPRFEPMYQRIAERQRFR